MMMQWINNTFEKQRIIKSILKALPDYFGIEEAIEAYSQSAETLKLLVCFDHDRPIGFLGIKTHYEESAELYVMGVLETFQRQGIGRQLVNKVSTHLAKEGFTLFQVKTLSEIHPDESYAKTRAFYRACGFIPLETLKTVWNEENPCLISVKLLK